MDVRLKDTNVRLKDKVSLITGAGSGIGQATALLLAGEGAKVVAIDRSQQAVAKTHHLIETEGGVCQSLVVDITQERQVANEDEQQGNNSLGTFPDVVHFLRKGYQEIKELIFVAVRSTEMI